MDHRSNEHRHFKMTSTSNKGRGMSGGVRSGRRRTFQAAGGAENGVVVEAAATAEGGAGTAATALGVTSDRGGGGARGVRWSVLPASAAKGNHNPLDASAAASTTPSKRIKDRFAGVASGRKNDAVFSYHFEGTPFSQKKKRRRKHHGRHDEDEGGGRRHRQQQEDEAGELAQMEATDALDDTFRLGENATAEISAINSMFAGDIDVDGARLSIGSRSSRASDASSGASSAASSDVDLMNCTTLSDTHELSTSNFIQNAKMRNLLTERAKDLFKDEKKASSKKAASARRGEKERASHTIGGRNRVEDAAEERLGGRKEGGEGNEFGISTGASSSGGEASATVSDITFDSGGVPSDGERQPSGRSRRQSRPQEQKRSHGEGATDEDEIIESTSRQKSRTPGNDKELSQLNSPEDGTRSVGGLDTMFADFDALANNDDGGENSGKEEDRPSWERKGPHEEASKEDGMLELTSRQISSKPRGDNDLSLPNSTISEDTTRSVGGLDTMFAEFDALANDVGGENAGKGEKSSADLENATAGRKNGASGDHAGKDENQPSREQKRPHGGGPKEDGMLQFSSRHCDMSQMNSTVSEDTTRSVGGLDTMFAEFDALADVDGGENGGKGEKSAVALEKSPAGRKNYDGGGHAGKDENQLSRKQKRPHGGAQDDGEMLESASRQGSSMPSANNDRSVLNSTVSEDTTRPAGGLDTMFAEFDCLANEENRKKIDGKDENQLSQEQKRPNEGGPDQDEMVEFSSYQRSSVPRGSNDPSLLSSTMSEDTTRSVGGLDTMFAEFDALANDDGGDSSGKDEKSVAASEEAHRRKDSTVAGDEPSNPSKPRKETANMGKDDGQEGGDRSGRHRGETSFAESTASQNDLNDLLGFKDGEGESWGRKEGAERRDASIVNSSTASQNALNKILDAEGDAVDDTSVLKDGSEMTVADRDKRAETSSMEPTTLQNDLNHLLGSSGEESTNNVELGNTDSAKDMVLSPQIMATDGAEAANQVMSESTPSSSRPTATPRHAPETAESSSSKKENKGDPNRSFSFCPSPFLHSGKKPRGSGIQIPIGSSHREALGGEMAKIRNLTASLRKRKRRKRMTLGAPARAAQQWQTATVRHSLGVTAGGGMGGIVESSGASEPVNEPARSPREKLLSIPSQDSEEGASRYSMRKSPPEKATAWQGRMEVASPPMNSPARNTRSAANKSQWGKSPAASVDSPVRNTRAAKKSFAVADSPSRNARGAKKSPTADSPARNTRGARKSPRSPTADTPARNARGARKSPRSPAADLPARNTRGARKSPSRKSPSRRTVTSPAGAVDSPARNTRSAKRGDPPERSPARSLFDSPSDQEINSMLDDNSTVGLMGGVEETSPARNGSFRVRKRGGSDDPAADDAHNEAFKPPARKRLSTSSECSETSLSKEYPFLSLSPDAEKANSSKASDGEMPTTASEFGTQTLTFGELMQGIQDEVGRSPPKENNISLEEEKGEDEEDGVGEEVAFRSKQSRSNRRETADTAELMGVLSEGKVQGARIGFQSRQWRNNRRETADTSELMGILFEGTIQEGDECAKQNKSPRTPGDGDGAKMSNRMPKTPKSILSSSKKEGAGNRPRRNVEFGSPEAAEYNIGSPSVSMTPMHPQSVRERYLMPTALYESGSRQARSNGGGHEEERVADQSFGIDERTEELEADLERLISKGNDTSIMLDPIDEGGNDASASSHSSAGASFMGEDDTQELEMNILGLVDDRSEESGGSFSLPSVDSVSSVTSHRMGDLSRDDCVSSLGVDPSRVDEGTFIMEPTRTVELKGTMAAQLDGRQKDDDASAILGEDTRTMDLESNLGALLEYDDSNDNTSAPLPREKDDDASVGEDTQTMDLEGNLGALLKDADHNDNTSAPPPRKKEDDASATLGEDTRTIDLQGNPGVLLEVGDRNDNTSAPPPLKKGDDASAIPREDARMMDLEGNLDALFDNNDRNDDDTSALLPTEETQTMELKGTLADILEDRSSVVAEEGKITIPSMGSSLTPPARNGGFQGLNDRSEDESPKRTTAGTIASLSEASEPDEDTVRDLSAPSQTTSLDSDLGALLEAVDNESDALREEETLSELGKDAFSPNLRNAVADNGHGMPWEMDTISEIGTVTTCHEPHDGSGDGREDLSPQSQTMPLDSDLGALVEGVGIERNLPVEEETVSELGVDAARRKARNTDAGSRHIMPREMDTISEIGMFTASHEQLHNRRGDRHMLGEGDTVSELDMETASHELRNEVAGNRHIMPREMDTISELGMNTAGHEMRTEKEFQRGLAQEIIHAPPEPVNLQLEEIVGERGIDWDRTVASRGDVFLDALSVASASACPSIKPASEKVLTQICEDIESQLHTDNDADSLFKQMIENNEELMRSLQRDLRLTPSGNGELDLKNRARLVLQASNEAVLTEWGEWLTDVTAVYNDELSNAILPEIQRDGTAISEKSSSIDQNREQIALPLLIKSARRVTRRNFVRIKGEVSSCAGEVSELEAQVKDAEGQLETVQMMRGRIHEVAKSNEKWEALRKNEKDHKQTADSSYYKFFSTERLHNWVLTGSSDSSISLVFRGSSVETSIQLTFSISYTLVVSLNAKFGRLPRSTTSFLSSAGVDQVRFHPAVSGFLNAKMNLLCQDMENRHISSPTEIPSLIQFAELRVMRIEEAAKEIEAVLGRFRNSFLQPSDSLKHSYDFTAYLNSSSRNGGRLHATLSIPDCYPFAPIGLHLQSTSSLFDTEAMTRQLKKATKPGFGALTRAIDAVQSMLN